MAREVCLPTVPPRVTKLDSGAIVNNDHGLVHWWDIEDWVDTQECWVLPPKPRKKFRLTGTHGY
ncbi:hypothetical protein UFOVP75_47 [uncultured Caudovirales phage]|uniref:Uncharacterized protein n=1 Tax=uncultured Caudovirales phage TaxID=2100421 RepID=A0A6J5L4U9_9CAUD|nr:hypothetical protein UFOVP75_47 [uncultured Caudovirales phage]